VAGSSSDSRQRSTREGVPVPVPDVPYEALGHRRVGLVISRAAAEGCCCLLGRAQLPLRSPIGGEGPVLTAERRAKRVLWTGRLPYGFLSPLWRSNALSLDPAFARLHNRSLRRLEHPWRREQSNATLAPGAPGRFLKQPYRLRS
jgi:hypothetical protein